MGGVGSGRNQHHATKLPHVHDEALLTFEARGYTISSLVEWLAGEHGIRVDPTIVSNRLKVLRAARRSIVLAEPPKELNVTRDELLNRILAAEYELFREAKTVPERRAAQREILKVIELERRFPVMGGSKEYTDNLSEILSHLRKLEPRTVLEVVQAPELPLPKLDVDNPTPSDSQGMSVGEKSDLQNQPVSKNDTPAAHTDPPTSDIEDLLKLVESDG